MDWLLVGKILASFLSAVGALGVLLGLPGSFVAWLGLLIVYIISGFTFISGWLLLFTFIGNFIVEVTDNVLTGLMVKKFGASKGSMLMAWLGGLGGSIVGGFIGSVAGFLVLALFTLIGAFTGSFIAVYGWERKKGRDVKEALRAAFGTVIGRMLGIVVKLGWVGVLLSLVW